MNIFQIFTLCFVIAVRDKLAIGQRTEEEKSESLSNIVETLWNADINRLNNGQLELDFQQRTSRANVENVADGPLFSFVDENVFDKPTYKTMISLLDNYKRNFGQADDVDEYFKFEQYQFLNAILDTDVMNEAFLFLKEQGKVQSKCEFRELLERLWFKTYSRTKSNVIDSSGFEHVFVGEIDTRNKTSGFHNWVQLYLQELNGGLDYYGYLQKEEATKFASLAFLWFDALKPIGSLFIGTSPEFEIALYTIVHVVGYSDVEFKLFDKNYKVKCFAPRNDADTISTCFPVRSHLTEIVNEMWDMDHNRLNPMTDFALSFQANASTKSTDDFAPNPLFASVDTNFFNRRSYRLFIDLLNNYIKETNVPENETFNEIVEQQKFMTQVLFSDIGYKVFKTLVQNGVVNSYQEYWDRFYQLWFEPYFRSSKRRIVDSSGFEHVFVGEIKGSKVSGFHSWVQFYLQEKSGNLNYLGYLDKPRSKFYASMKFTWFDRIKRINSLFFGTSPEFDISLYTLVYLGGFNRESFTLNGEKLLIRCFGINDNRSIGTCFPAYA